MLTVLVVLAPTIIFTLFGLLCLGVLPWGHHRLSPRQAQVVKAICLFTPYLVSVGILGLMHQFYLQSLGDLGAFQVVSLVPLAEEAFSSTLLVDGLALYMDAVVLVASGICLVYVFFQPLDPEEGSRYLALLLILTGLIMGLMVTNDLMTLFLFWEVITAGSCFLVLYRHKAGSLEATFKYLIMAILGSGCILFGFSLLFSLTGTLNFWGLRSALIALEDQRVMILAFGMIASGFCIEAAIVPFHLWLPDVYTSAPGSTSAFLSAIVDQTSYYVLIRVFLYLLTPQVTINWVLPVAVLAGLTIIVGNFMAFAQTRIKRLFAYVIIADIGYNLMAITSVTTLGLSGNLYFFFIGGITTAAAFMCVDILETQGIREIEDLKGLIRFDPKIAIPLVIIGFSFSGIPPLAGFIAKYLVFTATLEGTVAWLAALGFITTLLQTAYFLRLIHYMFSSTSTKSPTPLANPRLLVPIYIVLGVLLVVGLFPGIVLNFTIPITEQISLLFP